MDNIGTSLHGFYRDQLLDRDQQLLYDSGWQCNTIVTRCRILLAAFMKNDGSANGIKYLMVGRGAEQWDALPVSPEPTAEMLINPYASRIELAAPDFTFLNEADQEVQQPTSRLQVRAVLPINFPEPNQVCPLREFGLFGRLGSADFMINSVRHPLINKEPAMTLIRLIRLQF
jgi:hypothetical protein